MPKNTSFSLGDHFDAFVSSQVDSANLLRNPTMFDSSRKESGSWRIGCGSA